jgi:hypothetical protein
MPKIDALSALLTAPCGLGKIREAVERCELVMKDLVSKYDKKDVLCILNLLFPVVRVLKWHGGINRARAVFEQYMPEAPEHRPEVKCASQYIATQCLQR